MEVALPSSANEPVIHRLVDDILAYILLLNATIPEHAATVASSQVCTRWRSIALNYHTIWGHIIDYHRHPLKWIEILLDRSNPSLLDFGSRINRVYCAIIADDGQGVLELVFNHIDRLRIFNAEIPVSSWELVCSRFLQLPAPNLEFVHAFVYDGVAGPLTHPLFDNRAPNLQSLGLPWGTVDFTSPILTPLTELYVRDIANGSPTVLEWLYILGGMPSLRWVTLIHAISSAPANDICPVIHLSALVMLSIDGPFHESVTLVDHLIVPPRCGLRLRCDGAHLGFHQRRLWANIEKKMDSWARNSPNRHLEASSTYSHWNDGSNVTIGNTRLPGPSGAPWSTEAAEVANGLCAGGSGVDPVMTIVLRLAENQNAVPLFLSLFALFEWTFFDTTHLKLWIDYYPNDGAEVFLPLVDSFRGLVNLEKLSLGYDIPTDFPFPLLQQANSVILPALKSIEFIDAEFHSGSESLNPVVDFLRWRREQGFPVQKIEIFQVSCYVDREYILAHIQDTLVEINE